MHDLVGNIVLATGEDVLCEAFITVFRVRVQYKVKVNGDQIKLIFGLIAVVS